MTIILEGLNPELRQRIDLMLNLGDGHLHISSAIRTRAQQEVLYAAYIRDPAHNPTAAKPGTSNHERGLAVDVECTGLYSLLRASLAVKCGLHTPIHGEPWHMELDPHRRPLPPRSPTIQEANRLVGPTRKAVAVLSSVSGNGYMIVADDGGTYCFGDFSFHGSMAGQRLNAPITGGCVHPSGNGYWLIGQDGGVFAFGDAKFFGSGDAYMKS
jgi:hypothetical protein